MLTKQTASGRGFGSKLTEVGGRSYPSKMDKIRLDQYEKDEHSVAVSDLHNLAYSLNQANVSMILMGASLKEDLRKNQFRVVSAQLISAIGTLHAILRLTEKLSLNVREAIALSRVYYETCLVATFTALDSGDRAERAAHYSAYKAFHSQTKVQKAGLQLLKVDRHPRIPRKDAQVQAALEMFSDKRTDRCFNESRADMIAEISENDAGAGLFFSGVEGMIFDLSSEIIHGSLYGYEDFNGIFARPIDAADHLMSHFESVMFSVCFSSAALARVLNGGMARTPEIARIEKQAFSALKQFIPDELQEQLPKYFS